MLESNTQKIIKNSIFRLLRLNNEDRVKNLYYFIAKWTRTEYFLEYASKEHETLCHQFHRAIKNQDKELAAHLLEKIEDYNHPSLASYSNILFFTFNDD